MITTPLLLLLAVSPVQGEAGIQGRRRILLDVAAVLESTTDPKVIPLPLGSNQLIADRFVRTNIGELAGGNNARANFYHLLMS